MFIQQGKTNWIMIIIVALIAGAVSGGLVVYINDTIRQTTVLSQVTELKKSANGIEKKTACTQEAKICPDGSSVGRTGSNCEFTPCPDQNSGAITDWQTYQWNNLQFNYPSNWTVEKTYYQTPAQQAQGQAPENIGLTIFPGVKAVGKDFIAIGGRQASCDPSENHIKCQFVPSVSDFIYTDSNNPDILNIFDSIFSTIKSLK